MEPALLITKLFIPAPRADRVSRPRLLDRLDEGLRLDLALTLVAAPAGSGKTTLLSAWAARLRAPVAWLSLDAEDGDDTARFWTYVVAALRTRHADLGQAALEILQAPRLPPAEAFLIPLLNDLAALPGPRLLILDDYHQVAAPAIHEGLAFLLAHRPPQFHLAIAARVVPPLPLVQLRARGQITELHAEDLHFTPGEAAAFLSETMGLTLLPEDVATLLACTEGWAAGLQLAALSLQGREDARAFVYAFGGEHPDILDYLTREVLDRQPQAVQDFLLQTAILDRLCGSLCNAVTGKEGGEAMLAHLYDHNVFTNPLDAARTWYRYHPLFADLLRKALSQQVAPAQVRALHTRAARWYEAHEMLDAAVRHALAAEDFASVAHLAEQAIQISLVDSRLSTLLRWLQALPEALLRARPRLRIYQAWAIFIGGDLDRGEALLTECRRAVAALPPESSKHALTVLLDTMDAIALALTAGMAGKVARATQAGLRARALAEEADNVFLAALADEALALAYYYQGRLHQSARCCRRVAGLAEGETGARWEPARHPMAAMGYVELAGICLLWHDLEAAARHIDRALALCQQGWGARAQVEAYVARSRMRQALGDIVGAFEALHMAGQVQLVETPYSVTKFRLSIQRARLDLAEGRPEDVLRWVDDLEARFAEGGAGRTLPTSLHEAVYVIRARAHLAQNDPAAALVVLTPLYAPAEAAGRFGPLIEMGVLMALALHQRGDREAALDHLTHALALAKPEGYVQPFLDAGASLVPLLRKAAAQGYVPDFVDILLAAFPTQAAPVPDATAHRPPSAISPLIEPLTPRELEILALIAEGCTNRTIAERLVIALNTVKNHTRSIYGKLGVHNRTQAVARARELGVL